MMSSDGIKLNDISFKNMELNKPNEPESDDAKSAVGQANPASVNINNPNSYVFLNGKIIDEKI